ncbi:hypothetical protein O181_050136 [Austropuccinia psidii MF-1]|uniref:Beta-mannosidase n=1 Tax=Austropuccinia psidii MF-1 TaxID=1389203 RepID=A0A9Q3DTR1_9BASI|nr:hypothetical protein [Austropuccinia psidii MF-1]
MLPPLSFMSIITETGRASSNLILAGIGGRLIFLVAHRLQPAYLIGLSGEKEETMKSALSLSQNIPDFTPRPGERTTRISLQPFESGPSLTTGQGISAHLKKEKNQLTLQRRREKPRPNQLNTPPASFWIHRTVIDIHKKGQRNNLHPDQNEPWILNVTLPITSARSLHDTSLTLSAVLVGTSVRLEPKTLSITKPANYINLGPDYFLTAQYTIDHQRVELWYPAMLRNPKLHDLKLTLDFYDQEKNTSQLTWYERVGFQTIVVDQSRYSAQEVSQGITPGTRFTFVINGKPFYVQGSSMIPIDNFSARTNSSTIRWLIQSALLAHQNVVRIWGGGAYETDEFYDICDELGILAWSESVFACGAYPISPRSFLDNIRAEVAENIARLNRHPSTALWAGNNEGEGYLIAANRSWSNGSIYFNQYDYLYNCKFFK